MRRRYWYLCLFIALMSVIGCGFGSVLAGEWIPKSGKSTEAGTPSDAGRGSPSDAEVGTPSDAETGTPSDAKPDEIVLLMDIPDKGCRTKEELVDQLLDDSQSRIVLTSDIVWTENRKIVVPVEKEVEMGEYRILVGAESMFLVSGPVTFRGSGGHSLFEVRGDFCPGKGVEIHASGDHVVAVDIINGGWAAEFAEIHAEGRNAKAVRFRGSREQTVDICQIEAVGVGSRGIEAEGDIRLFLSSVSGEESAVSSEQGNVLLFGSHVSPEPEQASILPALFVPNNRLEENGFCVAVGASRETLWEKIERYPEIQWYFFSEGLELGSTYGISVAWSEIPMNFSVPGTYYARCEAVDVPEWFPAELYDIEVPIHIVDPARPFIMDAEDAGSSVLLRFFTPIREAQEIRVEYSADDRESWRDIEELSGSFVTETDANVEPLEPNRDYWFRLVVKGGPMEGISNEILFIGDEVRKANGGGDRDHGDRNDQGEDPPHGEIIPPSDGKDVDTGRPDAGKPDAGKPDAVGSGVVEPGALISNIAETDTKEPDKAVQESRIPEAEMSDEKPTGERMPDRIQAEEAPANLEEPSATDTAKGSSDMTTTLPGSDIREMSGNVSASGLQEPFQSTGNRLLWVLLPGVLALGGGVYVCWKKRKRNG